MRENILHRVLQCPFEDDRNNVYPEKMRNVFNALTGLKIPTNHDIEENKVHTITVVPSFLDFRTITLAEKENFFLSKFLLKQLSICFAAKKLV